MSAATRVLLISGFLLLGTKTREARAQISPQDSASLTQSLAGIATDGPGWPTGPAGQAAEAILNDSQYSASDWESFFFGYFSNHLYPDNLREFFPIRVFWNFSPWLRTTLQEGMFWPMASLATRLLDEHRADLGTALAEAGIRESVFNVHEFMSTYPRVGLLPSQLPEMFGFYLGHVAAYPEFFRKSATIDINAMPLVGALRAQVYMNLLDVQPLTADVKSQIATTLDLTGAYAAVWDDRSVLLIDNNGLDAEQLDQIALLLQLVPRPLIESLRHITVADFLGGTGDRFFANGFASGVNIFSLRIGQWQENSFPQDISPGIVDVFTVALAHEVNHIVDAYGVRNDAVLQARAQALLDAAGSDAMNYLRSMTGDGFFQQAPQEFIASIANQWFTDSEHTLRLGRVRFDGGRPHPLNQAVFFVDIYSLGSDSTLLYRADPGPGIERSAMPISRNANGHITAIQVADSAYVFQVDGDGNILSYEISESCLSGLGRYGDANGDGAVNIIDAQQIARFSVGLPVSNESLLLESGDVNIDGAVNIIDAQQIARFSTGLSTSGRVNGCRS